MVKNALSRTLLRLVFKLFKKKNFTFIKSAFVNNLRFFTNNYTHLLKRSNFGPQGPQNAALLSMFVQKIQILPRNFFLSGFFQNKLKLYIFKMDFMTNQVKLTVPKKC